MGGRRGELGEAAADPRGVGLEGGGGGGLENVEISVQESGRGKWEEEGGEWGDGERVRRDGVAAEGGRVSGMGSILVFFTGGIFIACISILIVKPEATDGLSHLLREKSTRRCCGTS